MPQVPTYDGPQVAQRPLQYDQATADSFGAQEGKALERTGAGLMEVGKDLDRINEREVKTQVFATEAKIKKAYLQWSQDQAKNRQGAAAQGLAKDTEEWWGKAAETFGADLNPMAQRMLQKSLLNQSLAARQTMGTFENSQLNAAEHSALLATTQGSIDAAVSNPSTQNITTQKANIVGAWETQRGKYDPQTFDTLVRGELSKMHVAVFNRLLVENPTVAKVYYDANQGEIAGQVKDEITARLKAGIADQTGGEGAREVFDKFTKDQPYTAPIPTDKIDAELVAKYKDQPEVLRAARAEMDRQVALRNKAQSENQAGAIEAVFGAMNKGMSPDRAFLLPGAANLSEQTKLQIRQQWQDRQHMLAARSVEDRIRKQHEITLNAAPTMLHLSDPNVLSTMTRADIMNKAPEIGYENVGKLLTTWQTYQNNQAKLSEAKLDNDAFKDVLASAGINPSPKTSDKSGAARVNALRSQFEITIGRMQQANKRELNATEKLTVMQDLVKAEVLTKAWYSSTADQPTPLATMSPSDMGNINSYSVAFVSNGKKVTMPLAQIPPADYADTQRYLEERRVAPTPANIARTWYEFKQRKPK